jgi:hypothetical protein
MEKLQLEFIRHEFLSGGDCKGIPTSWTGAFTTVLPAEELEPDKYTLVPSLCPDENCGPATNWPVAGALLCSDWGYPCAQSNHLPINKDRVYLFRYRTEYITGWTKEDINLAAQRREEEYLDTLKRLRAYHRKLKPSFSIHLI